MTIYERIKKRRKELDLSADDVANALGVSRATVYRYESSYIEKLPTSSLEPLAKVLKCSPAYLMGWDESTNDTFDLSAFEKQLVVNYRKADELDKAIVRKTLNLDQSLTEAVAGAKDKLA